MHFNIKKSNFKSTLVTSVFLAGSVLTGCATTAVQYNADNIGNVTDKKLRPASVPLETSSPLSIEEVRTRTLAHNSEYGRAQTQLIETIRKAGSRGKDFLPQAYASTYGNWRNNTNASVGVKVDDTSGTMPEDFYTAQDQAIAVSNFTTGWDLLEIGLSSFKANRRAINAYSQREQNQYLCNTLIVDVENAYWRAVAYEQAEAKSDWLKSRITYALNLSEQRAKEKPDTKLQELMFQRELIDINRWYQSLYRTLISAKPDLARLMNLPAGTEFSLQSTRLPAELGEIAKQDEIALISAAYTHRPEIRQSLYKTDLTRLKNKEDLWRHLPGLKIFLGGSHDSNSFVLNSNFASAGASLSWDLLRIGQIGKTKRAGNIALAEDQHQSEILAGAIMAQVMIAREQMLKLDYDLTLAWKALSVQGEITNKLRADVESGENSETYLVKEELMQELSFIREQMARAELHTAKARLQQSVGIVPTCQAPTSKSRDTNTPETGISVVSQSAEVSALPSTSKAF